MSQNLLLTLLTFTLIRQGESNNFIFCQDFKSKSLFKIVIKSSSAEAVI